MTLLANMGMEIDNIFGSNANNYNDVRSHTITSNKPSFRTVSKSSSKALVNYATRIEHLNDFPENEEIRKPVNSSQLLYAILEEQDNQVSKAADSSSTIKQQCVSNKNPALNKAINSNKNMFNVQLSYNVNQILDPES